MNSRLYVFNHNKFLETYYKWINELNEIGIKKPNLMNCEDIYDPGNYYYPIYDILRIKEEDKLFVLDNSLILRVEIEFFDKKQNFIVGIIIEDIRKYKKGEKICFSYCNIYKFDNNKKLINRIKHNI